MFAGLTTMDRRHELDRRSIVMLTPGVGALSREEALALLEELAAVRERLDKLQIGLRQLLDEPESR